MAEQRYRIEVHATGEVRDADGNLLSSTPVVATQEMSESELVALGYDPKNLNGGQTS